MVFRTTRNAAAFGWLLLRARYHTAHSSQEDAPGQGLVEYALILVMVAVVVIVVLTLLGPALGNVFSEIACTTIIEPQGQSCEEYFAG
jgi:pilus assembly protein Flp/PilA